MLPNFCYSNYFQILCKKSHRDNAGIQTVEKLTIAHRSTVTTYFIVTYVSDVLPKGVRVDATSETRASPLFKANKKISVNNYHLCSSHCRDSKTSCVNNHYHNNVIVQTKLLTL